MQYSVDDDPVEFRIVGRIELQGIGAHGVEADENVARNTVPFRVVERDDVRVIIVLQILAGYFQKLFLPTEKIGACARSLSLPFGLGFYPSPCFFPVYVGHFFPFCSFMIFFLLIFC